MNRIAAFLKLTRWPNLVFIALTQCLFAYIVRKFVYGQILDFPPALNNTLIILIVVASLLIAAAGYIINDYFDLNIDLVNKPDKMIIERYINRRWAIFFHTLFSFIGFGISAYVGYRINNIYIPFFNFLAIAALFFYSTTFKKKLLVGNVLISLLTAWVILVITVAEYKYLNSGNINDRIPATRLLKVSFLYAGFAFIISLIREVVKDMEDIQGDAKYGCRTMPIVWGVPVAKVFTGVWLSVLIASLGIIQFYVWQLGWIFSIIYAVVVIIVPLFWILRKLYDAQSPADYHKLSTVIKTVMFTGILSMLFLGM